MIIVNKQVDSRIKDIEIIERKGIGHPDTLADGIAEELSRKFCLSKGILERYFFDGVLIYGGESEAYFKGGKLKQPIKITIPAMMPHNHNNEDFIKETTLNYMKDVLHEFSSEYCIVNPVIYTTSQKFYDSEKSSDSSIATAHYPLSLLEKTVIETEQYLIDKIENKKSFLGEDIKIRAFRYKDMTDFIIACRFISKYIENQDDYFDKKIIIEDDIKEFIRKKYDGDFSLKINPDENNNRFNLSFLGSCIDSFAKGYTGKGNSISGLKSLLMPISSDGFYGKNIVRHPGRVHNVLAVLMAKKLSEKFDLEECYVHIVGEVGDNILAPSYTIIESQKKLNHEDVEQEVNNVINKNDDIRLKIMQKNLCRYPKFLYDLKFN